MFFDSSDLVESKYSMDHYREWAGEIANSYFNANALPTVTLTKIAQVEELTPHQIQLLAAEANKLIHHHKYGSAEEKYFAAEFPLADAKAAIQSLQLDGGEVKVASEFVAPKLSDQGPDAYEMFGIKPETMDKTAEVKHRLKYAEEKSALLNQKLEDQIFITKTAMEDASREFIKQARQHLLDEGSSPSRMKVLGLFDHFVKVAQVPAGKRLLAKLAYVLMKEGKLEPKPAQKAIDYFTKEGDQKAPAEMISENLPAQIVNGQHPLYVTLQTVGKHEANLLRYTQEGALVKDKARVLKQKIRSL
ncbi:MAG: hypothetical protein EBZ49_00375 [Proteobacteria bacterium]|nr:hypothetical protein [Pseudomonadota bacterium]